MNQPTQSFSSHPIGSHRGQLSAAFALILVSPPPCPDLFGSGGLAPARAFTAQAGPSVWGPWVQVASHGGVVRYTITAKAKGNSNIVGQVKDFGAKGKCTETFYGKVNIKTGNHWATVSVRFKGQPLGTPVRGTVTP